MEDRCIICGSIIPEGRQVCLGCENKITAQAKKKIQKMTDDECFLFILIALAVIFSFITSLLLNWP